MNQTSDRKIDRARLEYLRLVCEEPFRIFFPAGVIVALHASLINPELELA